MAQDLERGARRALPVPPVIGVDPDERAERARRALQEPGRGWVLQEFDGRTYVTHGTVRGPAARQAYLDGGVRPEVPLPESHAVLPVVPPPARAPVNLAAALAAFSDVYSPRVVARVNDYDVRVAHTLGEHVWHVHEDSDEFFLVLDGRFDVGLRDAAGERTVVLREGDTFVVPRGIEHRPSSPGGAVLVVEPAGTSSTGDRHEGALPGHADSPGGHAR